MTESNEPLSRWPERIARQESFLRGVLGDVYSGKNSKDVLEDLEPSYRQLVITKTELATSEIDQDLSPSWVKDLGKHALATAIVRDMAADRFTIIQTAALYLYLPDPRLPLGRCAGPERLLVGCEEYQDIAQQAFDVCFAGLSSFPGESRLAEVAQTTTAILMRTERSLL